MCFNGALMKGPWMVDVSSGLRQPQKTEIFKFDDDQLKNGSEAVLFYDFSAKTDTGSRKFIFFSSSHKILQ